MKIGVLGTGIVGRTLSEKLVLLGHDVMVGTRDPSVPRRSQKLGDWLWRNPGVQLGTFAQAASHGEMLINATAGAASLDALKLAGVGNLSGKVLIDVANPLDFSKGMPPLLAVSNTDSLGERIQRAYPEAKVVKALNTMNAAVMVDPAKVAGGDHTVFVAGNDAQAKAAVTSLLESFGWRDVLDLGDIGAARGAEMILPIWLRLMGALKKPFFNFKISR
jgi:hypothetical protein